MLHETLVAAEATPIAFTPIARAHPLAWLRRRIAFLLIVVSPTLLAGLYFGLLASDVFVSESRFVVRTAEKPDQPGGLEGLFKGFVGSDQTDLLFVRDYLLSRQVADELDRALALRNIYGEGDRLARFPAPWEPPSREAFFPYYQNHVKVAVDGASSVAALTVRGFTPAFVARLNRALLATAAMRIDALNAQIRRDASAQAEHELARALADLARSEEAIAAYRRQHDVIDPEKQAAVELEGGQDLAGKLVAAQAQLAQVRRIAPQSSQIPVLEAQVSSIARSLTVLRATVTSPASSSRSQTAEDYRAIVTRRDIATKIVAAATEARIRARADTERRHLYLEIVSQPSVPDEALLPRRLRAILGTFVLALICWGGVSLLWSGVREHRDQL